MLTGRELLLFMTYAREKEAFFAFAVGASGLAVELLCLQSVEVLLRHTFPL